MKKYLGLISLIVLSSFLIPMGVVLASYDYYVPISIYNNGTGDLTGIPILITLNNSQLAEMGYILSSGLDTEVLEGAASGIHSVADARLGIFIPSILGYQTRTYNYRLGVDPPQTDFPLIVGDDGYVTISDHADLELGDNFSLEWDGYVVTGVTGSLIEKPGVFDTYSDGGGNIVAEIYQETSIEQTSGSTSRNLYSGSNTRIGQRIDSFPASTIIKVSFYLRKQGSPTGTASIRVRTVSGDSVLGTIGTLDVSTLTGSYVWYDFEGAVENPSVQNLRFVIEYSGGDAANYVGVRIQGSDVTSGVETYYDGSWHDEAGSDATFKIDYTTLDVSVTAAVSSGEHEITVTADGTDLKIYEDDSEEDSVALAGASVIDTPVDWMLASDTLPYCDSYEHYVNGTLEAWYQPNTMVLGTSLTDRSGNGQTGTITWGSNPSVIEITIEGLEPYYTYIVPGAEDEDALPEVLPTPGEIDMDTTTGATGGGLPLYANFQRGANSLGWSVPVLYTVMFVIVSIVVGVAGLVAAGSIWGFVIGFGATSAFFGAVRDTTGSTVQPLFVTIFCVLFAVFIAYIARHS